MKKLLLTALAVLAAGNVLADVYTYTSEDGAVCFTDDPGRSKATLILRDPGRVPPREKKGVPPHLLKTGIADRISMSGVSEPLPSRLPVSGRISSHTGIRHDPIDGTLRMHNGVDIAVCEGTEVRPVAAGKVIFSGARPGYGNMVVIDHGDQTITVYAHNSLNLATEGTRVGDDTVIALSGSTGRSTGPHLHFEAWRRGENVTDECIGGGAALKGTSLAKAASRIRSYVDAEGTLVFTNMR